MSDALYTCRNTAFTISAVHTVLNVLAGANQPIQIVEWGVSLDGTTSSATPATVELMQSTQATAGTPGASAPAVVQTTGNKNVTVQFTTAHNYTAEPTVLTTIEQFYVPQYNGLLVKQYLPSREPESDLSGTASGVKGLCLRVTPSASVDVLAYMIVSIGA